MTNIEWQVQARHELEGAGLDRAEAQVVARLLLDHVTGTRHSALLCPNAPLEGTALIRLQTLLKEALQRRPLPHLLGQAFFYGLEFEVSNATLIPRPETELLVETALDHLKAVSAPRIADLGAGSGAIAVALATQRPDALVWGVDISDEARQIAARNAVRHGVEVSFLQGATDWLSPLEHLPRFDALASNPPYIATREIETLEPEVRDYEPRLALDGGADGLHPYRVFAQHGAKYLVPNGFFALELGAGQFDDVKALFEASNWKVLRPYLDLQGIARVLVAVSGADSAELALNWR